MPEKPMPETLPADVGLRRQIRRLALIALALVGLVFGGALLFAHSQKIAGAVLATGSVVTESEARLIQHREGGIVRHIHVKNGSRVKRGDRLVELDTNIVQASLASVLKQLEELYASQARLLAERDGLKTIRRHSAAAQTASRAEQEDAVAQIDRIYAGQQRLMNARLKSLRGTEQKLDRQIGHIRLQIEGVDRQLEAKQAEIALLERQIASEAAMVSENYLAKNRLMESRRLRARLAGELGELMSLRASSEERISQREIQKLRLMEDYWAGVLRELQQVRSEISQLEQQRIQARDILTRTLILAPGDGVVHNLSVHTRAAWCARRRSLWRLFRSVTAWSSTRACCRWTLTGSRPSRRPGCVFPVLTRKTRRNWRRAWSRLGRPAGRQPDRHALLQRAPAPVQGRVATAKGQNPAAGHAGGRDDSNRPTQHPVLLRQTRHRPDGLCPQGALNSHPI